MNNGIMWLILGLGVLMLLSPKPKPTETWVGGSQEAQMTAAQEIGF